jgi:hypothetical protein
MSDATLRTLNDSGFPLQVAVQHEIERTKTTHGWTVRYAEHAWESPSEGRSGFIDIVLLNQHGTGYLAVECKRPRDSEWVFLHSRGRADKRAHAQVWLSHFRRGSMKWFGWAQVAADPTCSEAQFCAVRGQSSAERVTLIEKTAAELVLATERLAHEHKDYRQPDHPNIKLFSCLLVTTATLKVARFDPAAISLVDGTLEHAEFDEVPFVRFRKQLGVHASELTPQQYAEGSDVAYLKESTVFVVNAAAISQFLSEFAFRDSSLHPYLGAA